MADPNVITAVARGLRPPLIFGAIATARSDVARLVATKQVADERLLVTMIAADVIQSPNNINLVV
ncbi:MAG: hypothetical protein O2807_08970 [bacterium]|nr:hypothetical protein [bacterium]